MIEIAAADAWLEYFLAVPGVSANAVYGTSTQALARDIEEAQANPEAPVCPIPLRPDGTPDYYRLARAVRLAARSRRLEDARQLLKHVDNVALIERLKADLIAFNTLMLDVAALDPDKTLDLASRAGGLADSLETDEIFD